MNSMLVNAPEDNAAVKVFSYDETLQRVPRLKKSNTKILHRKISADTPYSLVSLSVSQKIFYRGIAARLEAHVTVEYRSRTERRLKQDAMG
ncbi:hypothetical protein EVAR_20009_1 [Eumeta japonica]|uniref:Uncharacterized protein n=1 Tax=Eumeta variegata TaxID=151549 RepID=A0A4C1VA23_EUMVA|nr:hypothetical protein EVAR_20009_1 [Eumeta japonica]